MDANTHLEISNELVGTPRELREGFAEVTLKTTADMRADAHDLVHGGFVFGLADYAAMLAVNDPNVVLGSASTKFVAPVKVGETVTARANVTTTKGKRRTVAVIASVGDETVLEGEFVTFVLDHHVLER